MEKPKIIIVILLLISVIFIPSLGSTNDTPITINTLSYDGYVLPTMVVADYYLFQLKGHDTSDYVYEIFDIVNEFYSNSSIPIYFDVQGVMIFTNETENLNAFDYQTIGSDNEIYVNALLDSFSTFVDGNSTFYGMEEVQLLSGADFASFDENNDLNSNVVGLAWTGDPNITQSYYPRSVIQATFPSSNFVAKISAHEIGHNYAAVHDGLYNSCDPQNYIMGAYLNETATEFSSCSNDEIMAMMQKDSLFGSYIDDTIPIIDSNNILGVFDQDIGETFEIIWQVSDDNLGEYDIITDGRYQISDSPIIGNEIKFNISLDIAGEINLVLNVTDLVGHSTVEEVNILIDGDYFPELLDSPEPIVLLDNESSTLVWNISDDGNSSHFELLRNGTVIDEGNFTSTFFYEYELTNLNAGNYNYTLVVYDELNQTITSMVDVKVLSTSDSDPTSNPNTSEELQSNRTVIELVTKTLDPENQNPINSLLTNLPFSTIGLWGIVLITIVIRKNRQSKH